MRNPQAPPTTARADISAFKGACYTVYLFLFMTGIALIASAIASARSHRRNGTTLLVIMFVFIFIAFLLILVLIHTYWPDGFIYQRRAMRKHPQDEELARLARPVSISNLEFEQLVPKPLAVKTRASRTADLRRWGMVGI